MKSSSVHHVRNTLVCSFCATLAAVAGAQPGEPVVVDVAPCVDIDSVLERLNCYDELARAARGGDAAAGGRGEPGPGDAAEARADAASVPAAGPAPAPAEAPEPAQAPAPAAAPAATRAPPPSAAADTAGESAAAAAVDTRIASDDAVSRFGLPEESARARRRDRDREQVDEITSEVAALREIVPGQLEITLTNGQVWRQTNSDRYRLQVGYPVRVYPTRFGQYYRLTSEIIRGFVQVERIR